MSQIGLMIAILVSPQIQTASIGIPDTMFLMVLALIVFGPRRLPEIGRQIGKLMYEFRKVSNDFKFQMEEELRASEEAERQQKLEASRQLTLEAQAAPYTAPVAEIAAGAGLGGPALLESALSEAALSEAGSEAAISGTESDRIGTGSEGTVESGTREPEFADPVAGEVRGEPRKFPPTIKPPADHDPVMAQRPFRGRVEPVADSPDATGSPTVADTVTESGAMPEHITPVVGGAVNGTANGSIDEGRIGTEVQPGISEGQRRSTIELLEQGESQQQIEYPGVRQAEQEARHA